MCVCVRTRNGLDTCWPKPVSFCLMYARSKTYERVCLIFNKLKAAAVNRFIIKTGEAEFSGWILPIFNTQDRGERKCCFNFMKNLSRICTCNLFNSLMPISSHFYGWYWFNKDGNMVHSRTLKIEMHPTYKEHWCSTEKFPQLNKSWKNQLRLSLRKRLYQHSQYSCKTYAIYWSFQGH